ncbi:hypothetical protein ACP70R_030342 [Stipagrostis hirtigluma subsp. patula]
MLSPPRDAPRRRAVGRCCNRRAPARTGEAPRRRAVGRRLKRRAARTGDAPRRRGVGRRGKRRAARTGRGATPPCRRAPLQAPCAADGRGARTGFVALPPWRTRGASGQAAWRGRTARAPLLACSTPPRHHLERPHAHAVLKLRHRQWPVGARRAASAARRGAALQRGTFRLPNPLTAVGSTDDRWLDGQMPVWIVGSCLQIGPTSTGAAPGEFVSSQAMDRASSSSEASSSSSAALRSPSAALLVGGGWFPPDMKGKWVQLSVRNLRFLVEVVEVKEADAPWSVIKLKMTTESRQRFFPGDIGTLRRTDGIDRFWYAKIDRIIPPRDKHKPELRTCFLVHVPARDSLELANNVSVNVKPVVKSSLRSSSDKEKVKIGINGFGKIERLFLEMALQSVDVVVVAINDPSVAPQKMVKIWSGLNASIALKDSKTLVFEKRYFTYTRIDEKNEVFEHSEQMEVLVFRESNAPWEVSGADFVVELVDITSNEFVHAQVNHKDEITNNCLMCLPEAIGSCGLSVIGPIPKARFSADNQNASVRTARFNIVTSSTSAVKAVCMVFPSWDEEPTTLVFHATAPADRSIVFDMTNLDLRVTLEKAKDCTTNESSCTRFCDADEGDARRLEAIVSWCIDIVRCVPVAGCRLELL